MRCYDKSQIDQSEVFNILLRNIHFSSFCSKSHIILTTFKLIINRTNLIELHGKILFLSNLFS